MTQRIKDRVKGQLIEDFSIALTELQELMQTQSNDRDIKARLWALNNCYKQVEKIECMSDELLWRIVQAVREEEKH